MLLRHTTEEIKSREALVVNPAKTCQPIGAMYAALGIHNCLPHSHGSQGCCSYHRSTLTRHYKEPVMAGTSSFTEGAAVFGGQANLLEAITNMFTIYTPDVIAVHTTCLSETIGDDLNQIIGKAREEGRIPKGKHVIYASTPSYVGSHVTGFANMVKGMVDQLVRKKGERLKQVNIIPGFVEPADMREIKRILKIMGIKGVVFPDTADVLDTPLTGSRHFYPKGGIRLNDLATAGDSSITLGFGQLCSAPAARQLDAKYKVPCELMGLPIGLSATDRMVNILRHYAGGVVPSELNEERGRLIDVISDMHQYLYGKKVALFGDPDQLVSLTEFLVTLDMKPVYIVTGTPGQKFESRIKEITGTKVPDIKVKASADMFLLHQWIKNEKPDLLIGNTYGKYIARDEQIPFIRFGFPILDRVGHSYFPTVGYTGALRLVEKILEVLMDKIDRESPEHKVELQM